MKITFENSVKKIPWKDVPERSLILIDGSPNVLFYKASDCWANSITCDGSNWDHYFPCHLSDTPVTLVKEIRVIV